MTDKNTPEELSEQDLGDVQGGLILPAVQSAREAVRKTTSSFIGETEKNLAIDPDEQETLRFGTTADGSPNV